MSEQAQWTAAKVDELLHSGLSPCQDVADAINAAIAAERVETERWKQNGVNVAAGHYNLEKQLAAEREKVKTLHDEWWERVQQLNRELAAERKNREAVEKLMIETANAVDRRVKPLVDALEWLDEFVVEPEYFPADGDRQWWQEKRQSIRALVKAKEGK